MHKQRSTIFIPLAERSQQGGKLLEIYAEAHNFGSIETDRTAQEKDWEVIAAPLKSASLYADGLHVVNAIRKFKLKAPRWSIYQRLQHYAWLNKQRLFVGNTQFENCEGHSAQLGLALALLLNASNSSIRYSIATGALSSDKHADYDVAIGAVASVPQKLDLIIQQRQSNSLPQQALYCFTPTHYIKDGELLPVAELAQIQHLAALDIQVKPIAWLSEAAQLLQANRASSIKKYQVLDAAALILCGLVVVLVAYFSWLQAAIPIKLLPGKTQAEPFLVCTNRDNTQVSYADLERDGSTPLLPLFAKENSEINVGLGWKLVPQATFWSKHYYVTFIHLGEHTGFKLIHQYPDNAKAILAYPGEQLNWYWPMNEVAPQAQNNVLLILLQRTPIAAIDIEQALSEHFPDAKTSLDVLQARDFLLPQFPGSYAFSYQSIIRDKPCINF